MAQAPKKARRRAIQKPLPERRLYTRRQAAFVLATSVSTVRRLEAEGRLTPIKLNSSENGLTHYQCGEVHALTQLPAESGAV